MRAEIEPLSPELESLLETLDLRTLETTVQLFRIEGLAGAWPRDPDAHLTPVERQRALGFSDEAAARFYRQTRAALRGVLGRLLNLDPLKVPIRTGPMGKPYLVGGDLAFNLSHSGQSLLLGVTKGTTLGVDLEIERPRRRLEGLIQRCFSKEEQADFEGLDPEQQLHRFHVGWTIKEACLKAMGQGIVLGLERVVLTPDQRRFRRLPAGSPEGFQIDAFERGGMHQALVYRGPKRPIGAWQGTPFAA